jgi:hypothetical protein
MMVNKPRTIDINSISFDDLDKLPESIQKKMESSEEYTARVNGSADVGPVSIPEDPVGLQKPRYSAATRRKPLTERVTPTTFRFKLALRQTLPDCHTSGTWSGGTNDDRSAA